MLFMTVSSPPLPIEAHFTCTEIEFLVARTMLDGKSLNELQDALVWDNEKIPRRKAVARVFSLWRHFASENDIPLFTSSTSERILRALEHSWNLSRRGLAGFVRQKVDSIICSAPSQNLLHATAEVQSDTPWNKKVWTDYIIALARLKHRSMTMTELAKAQGITTAGATGSISRIERLWHVERIQRTDDKRVFDVRLTEKWRELIEKIEQFLSAK